MDCLFLTLFLSVCLSASLPGLIHMYVLVKLYFSLYKTYICILHAFKTLPKLGVNRLGGGDLGGNVSE